MGKIAAKLKVLSVLALVGLVGVEPILGETPGAMLTTAGSATVNGQAISNNSVVFSGDQMRIDSGSAVLRPKQFVAVLDANTEATYINKGGKDSLDVAQGSGSIALSSRDASVRYLGFTVTPRDNSAKVVIGLEHGRRAMMASEGPLIISKGSAKLTLLPGSALVQEAKLGQVPDPNGGQQQPAPIAQPPAPPVAIDPGQPAQISPANQSSDDYCSEENQSKDRKRIKKCEGGLVPAAAFVGFNVIATAAVAAGVLGAALYAFGAFSSTPPPATAVR